MTCVLFVKLIGYRVMESSNLKPLPGKGRLKPTGKKNALVNKG